MEEKSTKTTFHLPSSTIATPTSTSITISGELLGDEEREILYPEAVPSEAAVEDLTEELGFELKPAEKQQIISKIDHSKTYVSELETSLSLSGGFKLKIKREPQKTIRIFDVTKLKEK